MELSPASACQGRSKNRPSRTTKAYENLGRDEPEGRQWQNHDRRELGLLPRRRRALPPSEKKHEEER